MNSIFNIETIVAQTATESNTARPNFSPITPCPVCGRDHDNDCRVNLNDPTFILCHTYADARLGDRHNGYACIKEANGHTASFKLISGERSSTAAAALDKKPKYEKKARSTEGELSADIRHAEYSRLLDSLSLSSQHREVLRLRGFSDKRIDESQFKSIKPNQEVGDYPANLPGIRGGKISVLTNSIVYPVKDVQGRIVALWVRPDILTNGKYKPLSSPNNSIHLNGEIPLAFYPSSKNLEPKLSELFLTEGHGFKPNLANFKHDINVLSGSGGQFLASRETLKASLETLCEAGASIKLCPDAGDAQNKQCYERWLKIAKVLQEWGYSPDIQWWGQTSKEENDIDELENFDGIQSITVEQFAEIAKEEYEEFIKERRLVERAKKINQHFLSWRNSRKFTPTHTVNLKDFDFSEIPDKNVILCVNSGLGTDKTGWMLRIMKNSQKGAVIIGFRNNLLYQTIARGEELELGIYHIQDEQSKLMIIDDYALHALCLDSIKHVDGYFHGKDLFLDEACSVILHALAAGTLGEEQARAIAILSKAIKDCDRVFLLDGNLSDIYVELISKLCPEKELIKVQNTRKIAQHNITIVDGINLEEEIKKRDKSALVKGLLDPDCIPWIACDSRSQSEVLHEVLKASGRIGYTLHSESAGEDWAKEFLKNPNAFIEKYKPQYMIISPTAESGVSITINNYFTAKFTFFVGVLATNSQYQIMLRLRDNTIPHYVFCPEKSAVKDRSNPQTYQESTYKKIINDRILQSANLASDKAAEYLVKALSRQQNDWFGLSCKLGTFDNFEMDNLRLCLIHVLEEAGHKVCIEQWLRDENINEELKQARILVNRKKSEELFLAQEFSSRKEAEEAAKSNPRKDKQRQIEKTFLLDKLPEIKENEIWSADFIYECHVKRKNFIDQQYSYWLLNHYEVSKKRHDSDWFFNTTSEFFFSNRVKKMKHDKIWALHELNILQFEDQEYNKNSPEVIEFIKVLRERRDIQLALNLQIEKETAGGDERLKILSRLLDLVGLENKFTSQKLSDGIKLRHYRCQAATNKDYDLVSARNAILTSVEFKLHVWVENKKEDEWLEFEAKKIITEWDEMDKNPEQAQWLTKESIDDISESLVFCQDSEMFEIIKKLVPDFALKAAISLFNENEMTRLINIGMSKIKYGLYKLWYSEKQIIAAF